MTRVFPEKNFGLWLILAIKSYSQVEEKIVLCMHLQPKPLSENSRKNVQSSTQIFVTSANFFDLNNIDI